MESLSLSVSGQGPDLVMLHGWGMNSRIWHALLPQLEQYFRVTCIDLPGFGTNVAQASLSRSLTSIAESLLAIAPPRAMWLGWSLGGLVALEAARIDPARVSQILAVATSPCFVAQPEWPGMKRLVLEAFCEQLSDDFVKTLERFIAVQALGSATARQDIRYFKANVLQPPLPSPIALSHGLDILLNSDLREPARETSVPIHWALGRLDSLVPRRLADVVGAWPASQVQLFEQSAHAPFMTEPDVFIQWLLDATVVTRQHITSI